MSTSGEATQEAASSSTDLFSAALVAAYVDGPRFVPRPWLVDRVSEAWSREEARFVLLTGEPGSGKSALMADLARSHPDAPRRFIRRDSVTPLQGGDARSFLFSVGYQLAALHPELFDPDKLEVVVNLRVGQVAAGGRAVGIQAEDLRASPFYRISLHVQAEGEVVEGELVGLSLGTVVPEPRMDELSNLQYLALLDPAAVLAQADPEARIVVLVDALDEVRWGSSGESILDWLSTCPELPANVRIVCSCRPDPDLLRSFRAAKGSEIVELAIDPDAEADRERIDEDLGRYLAGFAAEPAVASALEAHEVEPDSFVEGATGKAQGNFQYVVALARGIDAALASDPPAEDLPELLRLEGVPAETTELYRFFLGRVKDRAEWTVQVPGAPGEEPSREPAWQGLYQPLLAVLAVAFEPLSDEQLLAYARVPSGSLPPALEDLGQFLDRLPDGRRRLYHGTFPEFLTGKNTAGAGDPFHVDAGYWHALLAGRLTRAHAGAWLGAEDDYAVAQTPSHLIDALTEAEHRRERERLGRDLLGLLTDLGYLTARVRLERGATRGLDHDYQQAAAAVPDADAATFVEYADALRRESHVLHQRHDDLFVQLVNRLLGRDRSTLERALESEARPEGEWLLALHPLPLDRALRRTLSRHVETTQSVCVTPDGTTAASASWDRTVCAWDVEDGRLIRQWEAGQEMLTAVVVSPDGTEALTRDFGGRISRWDVRTGREVLWACKPTGDAIAVTPDWSAILLASANGTVVLRDLAEGRELRRWKMDKPLRALAVAPDGAWAAAAAAAARPAVCGWRLDDDGDPVLFDVPDTAADDKLFAPSGATALAFSQDGRLLAGGGGSGEVWVWEVAAQRLLWTCRADSLAVNAVAVTAEDGVVLAGGVQGTVAVIDARTGEELTRLRGGTGQVMDLALTRDGVTLLSASGEGDVRVWDLGRARSGAGRAAHADEVTAIEVSPDGSLAASGSADGTLALWSLATGDRLAVATAHTGAVRGVAFGAGRRVLSAGEDGKVAFWNAPELERVRAIQTHQAEDAWSSGLQSLAILDERHVLAGGGDGRLLCVDLDTGTVTALGTSGDRSLTALRVAVDGRFAVSGSSDGAVERWPLNAGGQALPEPLGDVSEVRSLVVAPDGSHAIVGDLDGIVTSFAVDPAEPSVQLHGHVHYVDALATLGDGRLLVTGGWDRTLRLWNLVAQEEVGRYTWEVPIARAATVAREGREVVAVGDHQGAVFFLRIENGTV